MTSNHPATSDEGCVLIVDDDEDVRESLRDVVEMVGCSALMAASGAESLAVLVDHRPCLVEIDLLMPGMNGAQTLEAMRREAGLSATPVVISTSVPERAPRGVPVLPKPIDVDALCGWLRRVCHCQ
jgi:CheY-like chemotaxis protein